MNQLKFICLAACSLLLTVNVNASTLTLKDGQTLQGQVSAVDSTNVVFVIAGQSLSINRSKVDSIIFTDVVKTAKEEVIETPVATTESVASTPNLDALIIPKDTAMLVKTLSSIDSNLHKTGHKFVTTLDASVAVNQKLILPAGTLVYGQIKQLKEANRLVGKTTLDITFTHFKINEQLVPFKTTNIHAVAESTTKQTLSRTARLASIGGLANGSKGAENAAKAGLGISLITQGNYIKIPKGTLLEFKLVEPVNTNLYK